MLLADSIRSWYAFRDKAIEDLGHEFHELGSQRCICIWFNKNIRSKSRQYFYYNFGMKGEFVLLETFFMMMSQP